MVSKETRGEVICWSTKALRMDSLSWFLPLSMWMQKQLPGSLIVVQTQDVDNLTVPVTNHQPGADWQVNAVPYNLCVSGM